MTWQGVLAFLALAGLVVLLWNSHRFNEWSSKNTVGGTIFEGSIFDMPRWMRSPWPGRVLAVLLVVIAGSAWADSLLR